MNAIPGPVCLCGHADLSHDMSMGSVQPCDFPGCGCVLWRPDPRVKADGESAATGTEGAA